MLKHLCVVLGVCGAFLCGGQARAQAWPVRPIRLIVGFPPGGSVDQIARVLGKQLNGQLGQPIIVENRAGASGTIATGLVAKLPADGYTFEVVWDSHAVVPSLFKLPYDTLHDLSYISLVGTSPFVLVTSARSQYSSFAEAANLIKAGRIKSFGTSGTGSLGHLTAVSMFNRLGRGITHVPYKGGAPLIQDTLGGYVDLAIGSVFVMKPYLSGGTLKAIAVTDAKRSRALPQVPTVAEGGLPGFQSVSWWGVVAPAGISPGVAQRMALEIRKALETPEVAEQLQAQGLDLVGSGADAFRAFVIEQMQTWSRVVKDNHLDAGS
jgi:tripartite-type tricarboxylate transporter receptor subunit TctC